MVGGEAVQLERVRPILEVMGKRITHCGKIGSGQLTKLCNQILVSLNLLGVCECLLFAEQSGLDAALVIQAVAEGAAGSWQLSNLGPKIVRGDFAPGFMIDLIQKDLRLVLENAAATRTPLGGIAIVNQLFRSAQAKGCGRLGTQALAQVLQSLAASR
jgi:3-hydroxyisobutyrate dehydrogenase